MKRVYSPRWTLWMLLVAAILSDIAAAASEKKCCYVCLDEPNDPEGRGEDMKEETFFENICGKGHVMCKPCLKRYLSTNASCCKVLCQDHGFNGKPCNRSINRSVLKGHTDLETLYDQKKASGQVNHVDYRELDQDLFDKLNANKEDQKEIERIIKSGRNERPRRHQPYHPDHGDYTILYGIGDAEERERIAVAESASIQSAREEAILRAAIQRSLDEAEEEAQPEPGDESPELAEDVDEYLVDPLKALEHYKNIASHMPSEDDYIGMAFELAGLLEDGTDIEKIEDTERRAREFMKKAFKRDSQHRILDSWKEKLETGSESSPSAGGVTQLDAREDYWGEGVMQLDPEEWTEGDDEWDEQ